MKSIVTVIVFTLVQFAAVAQTDSTDIKKMGILVANAYANTNRSSEFMERLFQSYQFLLSDSASPAPAMIAQLEIQLSIPPDSAVGLFIDSSLLAFKRQHLWTENSELRDQLQVAIDAYNNGICPCLKEQTIRSGATLVQSDVERCLTLLQRDTSIIRKIRMGMIGLKPADQSKLFAVINQAMFDDCPSFYNLAVYSVKMAVVGDFVWNEKKQFMQFFESIRYYRKKNDPRLATIFPDHKKYLTDLDGLVKEEKESTIYFHDYSQEEKNGVTKRRAYVYRYAKNKSALIGELSYSVRRHPSYQMISYQFTPAGKMKDRAHAMKILAENAPPPPPTVEELDDLPPPPSPRPKKE